MRIIAGKWRGQRIAAPSGRDTRPTSDRVREAIFSSVYSMIGALDDVRVADLYAGSGALGFEALSRGAAACTFVESDGRAAEVLRRNAQQLGADDRSITVVNAPVERFVSRPGAMASVALLLADPPYRIDAVEFSQVLEALAGGGLLDSGALVVYEHSASVEPRWPTGFGDRGTRRYGDTAVSFATYEG